MNGDLAGREQSSMEQSWPADWSASKQVKESSVERRRGRKRLPFVANDCVPSSCTPAAREEELLSRRRRCYLDADRTIFALIPAEETVFLSDPPPSPRRSPVFGLPSSGDPLSTAKSP